MCVWRLVLHQANVLSVRIDLIHEPTHNLGVVVHRALGSHLTVLSTLRAGEPNTLIGGTHRSRKAASIGRSPARLAVWMGLSVTLSEPACYSIIGRSFFLRSFSRKNEVDEEGWIVVSPFL